MSLPPDIGEEITHERAMELYESGWWEDLDARTVALAQLDQSMLCMPFPEFHKAVEEAAGVPVWTHEFVEPENIKRMIENGQRTEDPITSGLRVMRKR